MNGVNGRLSGATVLGPTLYVNGVCVGDTYYLSGELIITD